jgi:pantothenate kinase
MYLDYNTDQIHKKLVERFKRMKEKASTLEKNLKSISKLMSTYAWFKVVMNKWGKPMSIKKKVSFCKKNLKNHRRQPPSLWILEKCRENKTF